MPDSRSGAGNRQNVVLQTIHTDQRAEYDAGEAAPVVTPLRSARHARGWSQVRAVSAIINLANKKGMTVASVSSLKTQLSRWENGHVTPDYYRALLCELYGKKPHELFLQTERRGGEDASEVFLRIQKLHKATVDPEILRHLQDNPNWTSEQYGSLDHSSRVQSLLKQRGLIESLLDECGHPMQRRKLFEIAGLTSGALGIAAIDRGDFPLARAYCLETFQLGDFADDSNIKAWALGLRSLCEYYVGRYDEALSLARNGLDYVRSEPQAMSFAVDGMALTARSFLASAYRAAGDLAAVAPLHHLNVVDCTRVLGADHPDTLVARSNLAYLYALQGDDSRALEMNERNLADYERIHGPDHPHTINARANLASSYRAAGDHACAIALHEQSVDGYARVFGPGHGETITARSNLAYAIQLAGDHARAIPLHRQVLADRERLYGPDHRYTELARQLLADAQQPRLTERAHS